MFYTYQVFELRYRIELGLNSILTMSDQQAFEELKDFFENRKVSRLAADPLAGHVEIGIVINDRFPCAFFKDGDNPKFEARDAKKPDVIFYVKPEAVKSLVQTETEDIGELGIVILKNYLAGSVRIKVKGSMINLLTKGYLGVIKAGGFSFAKFLTSHGISGLGKIKDVIQALRSKD
jgi:hypothetical protein